MQQQYTAMLYENTSILRQAYTDSWGEMLIQDIKCQMQSQGAGWNVTLQAKDTDWTL